MSYPDGTSRDGTLNNSALSERWSSVSGGTLGLSTPRACGFTGYELHVVAALPVIYPLKKIKAMLYFRLHAD